MAVFPRGRRRPGRKTPARAAAPILTRYAGMLGCGCTGTHDSRPSFFRRTAYISIRRGATWGVMQSSTARAQMHPLGEEGGLGEGGKSSTSLQAQRMGERGHGNKKKQQRQEAAQERHMASRGKE